MGGAAADEVNDKSGGHGPRRSLEWTPKGSKYYTLVAEAKAKTAELAEAAAWVGVRMQAAWAEAKLEEVPAEAEAANETEEEV